MAFESLGDKLQGVFKKLRGKGKLNEKDIKDAMREIKLALLEADVNFKVTAYEVPALKPPLAGTFIFVFCKPPVAKSICNSMASAVCGANMAYPAITAASAVAPTPISSG